MSRLSVVIVSYNTCALLRRCLESLQGAEAEIFVVDNASTDGSVAQLRQRFPAVTLLQNATNVGFASATNQALQQANGTYWLLLNPDTEVHPGALAALTDTLEQHQEAVAVGALLLNPDGTLQPSWARFPGLWSELTGMLDRSPCPYSLAQLADPLQRQHLAPFSCDWVGGAALCVRASAAQQAGLLDARFFLYSEELEWCHRLQRVTGGKVLLVPQAEVVHVGGASSRLLPRQARRWLWHSRLHYYRTTRGFFARLAPSLVATLRYGLSQLKCRREEKRA